MKLQIRTIDLDKNVCKHILSPREGSNVAMLLAFKALLLDFPNNWREKMDQ